MTSRKAIRRSVPKGELPAFTPVPRKHPRHDGWTPERQKAFIEALADTGCVAIAARMVNMSQAGVYQLRRQPGAESFRAAMDAAQTLGLQAVKDEAFHRAMHGQLVPVFVGGRLMGFRRKKNDGLLMFILRHYDQDASGRKTTINYFSTRAGAVASAPRPLAGEGLGRGGDGETAVAAEASTTTVRTVISGGNAPTQRATDDDAAALLNAFEGVPLDAEAQAEIYRTLTACAERRRALEGDPENDPECDFVHAGEAGDFLGELEGGTEEDWVEYRPEGEHRWESLGEGGGAAEIDEVLRGIEERKQLPSPHRGEGDSRGERGEGAEHEAKVQHPALPPPAEPDPDDPMFDWRNWSGGGYTPPAPSSPESALLSLSKGPTPKPRKRDKKRQPKPPFSAPDEARKAEAAAEVAAERRELAAGEAERRRRKKRRSLS